MTQTNILTLVERPFDGPAPRRGLLSFRRPKNEMFLDFFVDGKALRTWIQEWEDADRPPEETSLLTPARPEWAVQQIDRLLGRTPHQYWNRAWLLFCSACWTEDCGGVTADLRLEKGLVHWSGIGWDDSLSEDTYRIETALDFVFDAQQYEQTLLEARARFTRRKRRG